MIQIRLSYSNRIKLSYSSPILPIIFRRLFLWYFFMSALMYRLETRPCIFFKALRSIDLKDQPRRSTCDSSPNHLDQNRLSTLTGAECSEEVPEAAKAATKKIGKSLILKFLVIRLRNSAYIGQKHSNSEWSWRLARFKRFAKIKNSLKSLNRVFRPDLFGFYGLLQCICSQRFESTIVCFRYFIQIYFILAAFK